jgi:hypothetical protein
MFFGQRNRYQNGANGSRSPKGHGHSARENLEGVTAVGREHGRGQVESRELLSAHYGDDAETANENMTIILWKKLSPNLSAEVK